MNALHITLKLESPLLLTGVGNGEENSSYSLKYIPGSALRGAAIARYLRRPDTSDSDTDFEHLFFSGDVKFLNAYPVDQAENRMVPVPASWRIKKGEDLDMAEVADWAVASDQIKTTGIRKPYLGKTIGHGAYVFSPDENLAIHIASQERGVIQGGQSTVFQYQSLSRGQQFKATIIAPEKADLEQVKELLKPGTYIYLGRSRSAGYGKVLVEQVSELEEQKTETAASSVCTITLMSDAILRDEKGQPTFDLDGYLSRKFNKTVENQAAFIRSTETGGFNRKWKLPLPQMPAIAMGSVFVYPAGQLTDSDLNDLVENGIGERRIDGFGQVAVNISVSGTQTMTATSQPLDEDKHPLGKTSTELIKVMAERLLRHTLELNLITVSGKYALKGHITNHQLARLHSVLQQAIDSKDKDLKEITVFFENLKQTAADQWNKARLHRDNSLNGTRLRLWIEERVKENDGLKLLGVPLESDFPAIAGVRASLNEPLKQEYTLRLMEAVIDHVMKFNKES